MAPAMEISSSSLQNRTQTEPLFKGPTINKIIDLKSYLEMVKSDSISQNQSSFVAAEFNHARVMAALHKTGLDHGQINLVI